MISFGGFILVLCFVVCVLALTGLLCAWVYKEVRDML